MAVQTKIYGDKNKILHSDVPQFKQLSNKLRFSTGKLSDGKLSNWA